MIGLTSEYNLYYAPDTFMWVDLFGLSYSTKNNRKDTEPRLPDNVDFSQSNVEIIHRYRNDINEHAYLYVKEGCSETKIGQVGKVIEGSSSLS